MKKYLLPSEHGENVMPYIPDRSAAHHLTGAPSFGDMHFSQQSQLSVETSIYLHKQKLF